jgi:class 3 adenylate cyclase
MAVFIGDFKNTSAAKAALQINWAMQFVIRPALNAQYSNNTYVPGHGVGIDTSPLLVARIGVKNDNDLVWVGRAANHAAKLSDLRDGLNVSWISKEVYDALASQSKLSPAGENMWQARTWGAMNNRSIYCSSWRWSVD